MTLSIGFLVFLLFAVAAGLLLYWKRTQEEYSRQLVEHLMLQFQALDELAQADIGERGASDEYRRAQQSIASAVREALAREMRQGRAARKNRLYTEEVNRIVRTLRAPTSESRESLELALRYLASTNEEPKHRKVLDAATTQSLELVDRPAAVGASDDPRSAR